MTGLPVSGVSELVLEVLDLERAVAFYEDVLGLRLVRRSDGRAWLMAGDRTRIGLWVPQIGLARGRGGVHVHYAMHIGEDDLDSAVERIAAHGYEVDVIRFDDDGRGRAAYVSDPDGNVLELWTFDVRGELDEVA